MASKTEICNMALSHLGIGEQIANVDTERSSEAATCRVFYDTCRDATLEDFPMPFSRKIAALGLVQEDPSDEWKYEYRYPSDCIQVRKILVGNPYEDRQSRETYNIAKDHQGLTILCNKADAEIEYTERVTNSALYPASFVLALSFRLAAYMAPRLTKGDPTKIKNDMLAQYEMEISRSRRNKSNEQQDAQEVDSELIRTRL